MNKEFIWAGAAIGILTGIGFLIALLIKQWGLSMEINAMRWNFFLENWRLFLMSFGPMILGGLILIFAKD